MSDPNKDWLDAELKNLRDLEAPETLLPRVMKTVRHQARKAWWVRLIDPRTDLGRSFVLGVSLLVLGLFLLVNPAQFFLDVPFLPALLKLIPLLLDTAGTVLFQVKIYHFSLLTLLVPAIVLSYLLLIFAASAIQRLAGVRK
ncbi:MAG: hypothetical protein JO151_03765 [Verrucomicrobia bacterium]|nr:hypothetical protein [Verrucomicrobiota bacterium]